MLFYAFNPADLANRSEALTPYETSSINRFHLASYVRLDYLAAQVLDAFHIQPRQTLLFCLKELDLNQLLSPFKGDALPMSYL